MNSGRCAPAYLFADLYAASSGGDRRLGRAVRIEGRANDYGRLSALPTALPEPVTGASGWEDLMSLAGVYRELGE
jgi:hypothetical protein